MSTITPDQLTRYKNEGWRVIEREGSKVTLEKESHIAEDVGRSIGYAVTAPVVFTFSLVGSILSFTLMPCCCTLMAAQAGNDGNVEEGSKYCAVAQESLTCVPAARILSKANKGFFDWAEPFQSTTRRRTYTLISTVND